MMFKNTTKIKQSNISALMLTLCISFSLIYCTYSKVSLDYENFKNKFNKSAGLYKLENYLRKIKMKNFGIFTDKNKDNFIFLDNLNFIHNSSDLNLDKIKESSSPSPSTSDKTLLLDEFKARIFSYVYKNFKNGKLLSLQEGTYKPVGVNFDEEKEQGWRIYLVLMNSTKENKHKLLKVCFRENAIDDNFAIVQSFDQSCKDIIKLINTKGILKKDNSETARKLHYMQDKLLNEKLRKKIEKSGKGLIKLPVSVVNKNKNNSFLETASLSYSKYGTANTNNMNTAATTSSKTFSMDQLAQKFSVEELAKIKSLIKFAKKNKILDEIFNHKGEMSLEDFIKERGIPLVNPNNSNSKEVFPIQQIQPNMTNLNLTDISTIKSQIQQLKSNLDHQETKIDTNFKILNQNMTSMKDTISFVNNLASEFQKSLLDIGTTLSIFKTQLNQIQTTVNNIQNSTKINSMDRNNFNIYDHSHIASSRNPSYKALKRGKYLANKNSKNNYKFKQVKEILSDDDIDAFITTSKAPVSNIGSAGTTNSKEIKELIKKNNFNSENNAKSDLNNPIKNSANISNSPFLATNEFDFGEDDVLETAKEKNLRSKATIANDNINSANKKLTQDSGNKKSAIKITNASSNNNSEDDDFINP
jgi:hypothetical protein